MSNSAAAHAAWACDYLGQDQRWLTREGQVVQIDDMHPDHRRNVLRWLREHADQLHGAWLTALLLEPQPQLHADRLAQDAAIIAHRNVDPAVWLDDTPLVRKLATLEQRWRFLANPRRWFR